MNYKILNGLPRKHKWKYIKCNGFKLKGILWQDKDVQIDDTILLYRNWSSVHFNSDWYEIATESITGEEATVRDIYIIKSIFKNKLSKVTTIIDVNCGSGRHLSKLSDEGIKGVGMEGAKLLRSAAKERAKILHTSYTVVSTSRYYQKKFGQRADFVTSLFNAMGYTFKMADDIKRLRWMATLLKPYGYLLLDFRSENFQKKHYSKPSTFRERLYIPAPEKRLSPVATMVTTKYWKDKILAAKEVVTYKDKSRETIVQRTTYGWRTYSLSELKFMFEIVELQFVTYRLDYYSTIRNKGERIFVLAQKTNT